MTDITRLTKEMKAAAEKAKHAGEAPVMPFDTRISTLNEYQLTVCPDNVLALLEALELKEEQRANWFQMAQKLGEDLDAAEKRNTGLVEAQQKAQRAGNINNQWKPDVCSITGRRFFMWIEHPELGYVPTYGGPYDSYTIPTRDSSGEFSCERYDHDVGGWVDDECIRAYLIDDDE